MPPGALEVTTTKTRTNSEKKLNIFLSYFSKFADDKLGTFCIEMEMEQLCLAA